MVKEAEQFKEQDEAIARKVEAKNKLESYIYNVKSSVLGDEKMKSSLGADIDTVQNTVDETIKWLEDGAERTQEEYEDKQKEVEGVLMPIIQKGYQSNMPAEGGMSSGPKVEEVD
jgi:L1 cell adhesion molecule like protein